jgi:hypothetical protein
MGRVAQLLSAHFQRQKSLANKRAGGVGLPRKHSGLAAARGSMNTMASKLHRRESSPHATWFTVFHLAAAELRNAKGGATA